MNCAVQELTSNPSRHEFVLNMTVPSNIIWYDEPRAFIESTVGITSVPKKRGSDDANFPSMVSDLHSSI